MACSRGQGTSVPMTAAVWSRRLSSGGSRSMRAASTRLHRGRHLHGGERLRQTIGPRLADQHPGLHQGAHTLLQKEGIALRAGDQEPGEGRQAGVVPQQGLEEFVGARSGQRIEPQLRVGGFTAPAVLILRAVVDQEQEPGGRQALDQAIEQGLRLGIDPVQIFEHQQQRLHLAFAQQQALERLQGAPPPLRGVERQERTVVRQGFQQRQQRRARCPGGRHPASGPAR